MKRIFMALFLATVAAMPASAATLYSQYLFDDGLDGLGNSTGTGVGTISGGTYAYDQDEGWAVNLNTTLNTWSFVMRLESDEVNSFNRLLDLNNTGSDNGLYATQGNLRYTPSSQRTGVFNANVFNTVVLTFDGVNTDLYLNGGFLFTLNPSGAAQPAPLNSFIAVQDDSNVGTSGESSGGTIDYIEVYSGVLTGTDIANLGGPAAVPLPAGVVLLLTGLGALGVARRRRAA